MKLNPWPCSSYSSTLLLLLPLLCSCAPPVPLRARLQHRSPHKRQVIGGAAAGSVVGSLLSSLLQETLYSRMENLLLDPGRKTSAEKRRIVETAVENYHQQAMEASGENAEGFPENFSKLAGKLPKFQLLSFYGCCGFAIMSP